MREQVLDAVVSVQYDSATLPAEQLGISVPPEPFSRQQQRQSRLDGGAGRTRILELEELFSLHVRGVTTAVFVHRSISLSVRMTRNMSVVSRPLLSMVSFFPAFEMVRCI